jgi:hypothetical protein
MTRYFAVLAMALAAACGGDAGDTEAERYCPPGADQDPGQAGRIDGSVCDDGIFSSSDAKDAYCKNNREAWFCSEVGSIAQAWSSAEYHGWISEA